MVLYMQGAGADLGGGSGGCNPPPPKWSESQYIMLFNTLWYYTCRVATD